MFGTGCFPDFTNEPVTKTTLQKIKISLTETDKITISKDKVYIDCHLSHSSWQVSIIGKIIK